MITVPQQQQQPPPVSVKPVRDRLSFGMFRMRYKLHVHGYTAVCKCLDQPLKIVISTKTSLQAKQIQM